MCDDYEPNHPEHVSNRKHRRGIPELALYNPLGDELNPITTKYLTKLQFIPLMIQSWWKFLLMLRQPSLPSKRKSTGDSSHLCLWSHCPSWQCQFLSLTQGKGNHYPMEISQSPWQASSHSLWGRSHHYWLSGMMSAPPKTRGSRTSWKVWEPLLRRSLCMTWLLCSNMSRWSISSTILNRIVSLSVMVHLLITAPSFRVGSTTLKEFQLPLWRSRWQPQPLRHWHLVVAEKLTPQSKPGSLLKLRLFDWFGVPQQWENLISYYEISQLAGDSLCVRGTYVFHVSKLILCCAEVLWSRSEVFTACWTPSNVYSAEIHADTLYLVPDLCGCSEGILPTLPYPIPHFNTPVAYVIQLWRCEVVMPVRATLTSSGD